MFKSESLQYLKNGDPLCQAIFIHNIANECYHVFSQSIRDRFTGVHQSWQVSTSLNNSIDSIKADIDKQPTSKHGWNFLTNMLQANVKVNDIDEVWEGYQRLKAWKRCKKVIALDYHL